MSDLPLRANARYFAGLACLVAAAACDDGSPDVPDVSTTSVDASADRDAGMPYEGLDYSTPELWLCHPDLAATDDACRRAPLHVSDVSADGTASVRTIERAADPAFDCFYVYPTVSDDSGGNSDLVPDTEPGVTFLQAARYGEVCEVFAPLYRQATRTGLVRFLTGEIEIWDTAYADVRDAFEQYLAERPDRPFLLVGHSQGNGHLTRLIQEEIETSPELSERMVAAHLLGPFPSIVVPWSPETGEIEPVGGTFASTPICETRDQVGCVVTFSSFRASDPPLGGAIFAVPEPDATPPRIAACTHPAALGGGAAPLSDSWVNTYIAEVDPESSLANYGPYVDPARNEALTTVLFSMPGLLSGACEIQGGYHVLSVTIDADPADPRIDDIVGDVSGGWGLHLADVSLVLDDLVALAASQARAWDLP